jgi:hypothetical protein
MTSAPQRTRGGGDEEADAAVTGGEVDEGDTASCVGRAAAEEQGRGEPTPVCGFSRFYPWNPEKRPRKWKGL